MQNADRDPSYPSTLLTSLVHPCYDGIARCILAHRAQCSKNDKGKKQGFIIELGLKYPPHSSTIDTIDQSAYSN